MIETYNVCDNCNVSNKIVADADSSGIKATFTLTPAYKEDFFNTVKLSLSFCDMECYVAYLKENFSNNGITKGIAHETK